MKKKKTYPLIRYLLYLLIVTMTVTGVSLSRYATSVTGTDQARVAKFDVTVTPSGWTNGGTAAHAAGGSKACDLIVTNNSEVAVYARLVIDSGAANVTSISPAGTATTSAWFALAIGGSQTVTVNITGSTTGNNVQMHVEYEQID